MIEPRPETRSPDSPEPPTSHQSLTASLVSGLDCFPGLEKEVAAPACPDRSIDTHCDVRSFFSTWGNRAMHSKTTLILGNSIVVNAHLWDPDQWFFNLPYLIPFFCTYPAFQQKRNKVQFFRGHFFDYRSSPLWEFSIVQLKVIKHYIVWLEVNYSDSNTSQQDNYSVCHQQV